MVDADGNLYIADTGNGAVRKVTRATGVISTIATLGYVAAIAVGPAGDLYFGSQPDENRNLPRILHTDASGKLIETWGRGEGFAEDGTSAATAPLGRITSLAIQSDGDVLVAEGVNNRIRRINMKSGKLETVAGIGPALIGEEGPATAALLYTGDLWVRPDGSLLLGDASTPRFRIIDRAGEIHTLIRMWSPEEGGPFGPRRSICCRTAILSTAT